jgi:putative aminopeptidase FrvX
MDRIETLLKEFTEAAGVSGAEGDVFALMRKHLGDITEVSGDRLGSFIGKLSQGKVAPRIMLTAHMDEIGLMVSHFTGNFVRFNALGGWWAPRLIGLPVRIITRKGDIPGVVATQSPFLVEKEERDKPVKPKDMFIDVGLIGKKKPEDLGIRPGDPVVPVFPFTALSGGKTYMAKAWDDRLGCAVIVEVMRKLSKMKLPCGVYAVGTVQEEVGIRGAVTSGHAVSPDVCFAVDVNIARDLPGSPDGEPEKLGGGVSICVFDATLIPNTKLRDLVADVADRGKIPYHFSAVPFGGTDGGRIHLNESGVPTLVIGIPTRYIHSAAGIVHRKDFDSAVKLLVEVTRALDAKTVAGLY